MSEKDNKLNKGSFLCIGDQDKAEWGVPEGYPYKEMETIIDGTFEFVYQGGVYVYRIGYNNFTLVDGKTYTVVWDGETYQCVATPFEVELVLGNLALIGAGDDTGEPFLFAISDRDKFVYAADTAATHIITVCNEVVYPIASEFLPQPSEFLPTEEWTFTLENGSTVTKKMAVSE